MSILNIYGSAPQRYNYYIIYIFEELIFVLYNKGVYPTMITPYTKDGDVDYITASEYVKWYFNKGCSGVFSVCQSSEINWLSLEERVKLNKTVWETARELEKETGRRMTVVSSGHVSTNIDESAYELNKIIESGTDAIILITNKLDLENRGDSVWIENAERLLKKLPDDVFLGLYECPLPYKRLVTPKILKWAVSTGRFRFMKDTCCDVQLIKERLEILSGTDFLLMNANCQTLLSSLQNGGAGYSGIMANYHPELYVWLCENFDKDPEKAELVQALLGTAGFTETGIPYPLTAKYHMCLEGIHTENYARNRKNSELTQYAKNCTEQIHLLCKQFYQNVI